MGEDDRHQHQGCALWHRRSSAEEETAEGVGLRFTRKRSIPMARPKTKILVDGGDPQETRRVKELLGFVDGQTTNPSLLPKTRTSRN
jgi:hypothetical protein